MSDQKLMKILQNNGALKYSLKLYFLQIGMNKDHKEQRSGI